MLVLSPYQYLSCLSYLYYPEFEFEFESESESEFEAKLSPSSTAQRGSLWIAAAA
jgi:hypothetical protein